MVIPFLLSSWHSASFLISALPPDQKIPGYDSDEMIVRVYGELRRLAYVKMNGEKPQTLRATALVHEAYLRLRKSGDGNDPGWKNERHFFHAAAEAMRRMILTDCLSLKRLL